MRPGETDHVVVDSRGKFVALLLRSAYPDELSLERARKLYQRGQPDGRPVTIRARNERAER